MDIKELLNFEAQSVQQIVSEFKSTEKYVPSWEQLQKAYIPEKHQIVTDKTLRPSITQNTEGMRDVPAKVTYSAEKVAVRKMTQMMFTIPVKREYNADDNADLKAFADAIEAVYKANRIDGINYKRFKAFYIACEMASVWFVQETETHNKYGYPCNYKIRCRSFSPADTKVTEMNQAFLYPHFDEFDDMDAFMMEYATKSGTTTINHYDFYTADMVYYCTDRDSAMHLEDAKPSPIGKIQLAYINSTSAIYEDIENNRYEIEFALSRESDLIKKNSNPIIHVAGQLAGAPPKGGATREVVVTDKDGKLSMLSPAFNTTATADYVSELKKNIEEVTQMPNLALENIKSLSGVVTGEARKTLLTDAHMKVGEQKHSIAQFLDREFSVIKSLVAMTNTKWQKLVDVLECEHIITPFVLNDEASEINNRIRANGGLPIESQKESITRFGRTDDVEQTLKELQGQKQEEIDLQSQVKDIFG